MTRLEQAFKKGKAFIPFITCGDPSLDVTARLVAAMEEAGADIIELGIPFSDPTAEGPVIQAANIRAMAKGTTTDRVFDMVAELRKTVKVPLMFMTYANVVFSYGTERFAARCAQVGIDGIILPDVPFEEREEFVTPFEREGLCFISMIAPTSKERIAMIAAEAKGFLYCVSSLGVTGTRTSLSGNLGDMLARVREVSPIPCAVGFGVSTPDQAKQVAALADGVIVGSAIVRLCEQYGPDCVDPVARYVAGMKRACVEGTIGE